MGRYRRSRVAAACALAVVAAGGRAASAAPAVAGSLPMGRVAVVPVTLNGRLVTLSMDVRKFTGDACTWTGLYTLDGKPAQGFAVCLGATRPGPAVKLGADQTTVEYDVQDLANGWMRISANFNYDPDHLLRGRAALVFANAAEGSGSAWTYSVRGGITAAGHALSGPAAMYGPSDLSGQQVRVPGAVFDHVTVMYGAHAQFNTSRPLAAFGFCVSSTYCDVRLDRPDGSSVRGVDSFLYGDLGSKDRGRAPGHYTFTTNGVQQADPMVFWIQPPPLPR